MTTMYVQPVTRTKEEQVKIRHGHDAIEQSLSALASQHIILPNAAETLLQNIGKRFDGDQKADINALEKISTSLGKLVDALADGKITAQQLGSSLPREYFGDSSPAGRKTTSTSALRDNPDLAVAVPPSFSLGDSVRARQNAQSGIDVSKLSQQLEQVVKTLLPEKVAGLTYNNLTFPSRDA